MSDQERIKELEAEMESHKVDKARLRKQRDELRALLQEWYAEIAGLDMDAGAALGEDAPDE